MNISLSGFLQSLANLAMLTTVVLTLGVIFVNSWIDAPNAIATIVTTRGMVARPAIIMSAVFNFSGILIMTQVNASVAGAILNVVDFGGDARASMTALAAALLLVVIYSVGASIFGIPTGGSHSLTTGSTGTATAIQSGFKGINWNGRTKVLYGMVLSLVLGFALGWIICKRTILICQSTDRRKTSCFFSGAQIVDAAVMSFMHRARDSQKFTGALLLGMTFVNGQSSAVSMVIPVWLIMLCLITMGVGTGVGGEEIVKSVGMGTVKLELFQGFSSDLAEVTSILTSILYGIPISTTHAKTSSIIGAGAVKGLNSINLNVVKNMVLTWIFAFPRCGFTAYLMAKLFLLVF